MEGGLAENSGADTASSASPRPKESSGERLRIPVRVQIPRTEERSSVLKTFTVYIIHVSDFGRHFELERRFDDFAKLHAEAIELDSGIPDLPEKKMWASTDASTVAERRPVLEKILRYMLRSEDVVYGQALWRFLEMPAPGVATARFMFKAQQLNYARQCGKLLDPKYEQEHAYRLAHESVIKTNLQLLTVDLLAISKAKRSMNGSGVGEPSAPYDPPARATSSSGDGDEADLEPASPEVPAQEAEAAALEMLRWAIANGGPAARRTFLDSKGLAAMLGLLFRKGREAFEDGKEGVPHPQVRTVMNALVKAEGEKYSGVFAEFLSEGGVTLLSEVKDVIQRSQAFSEFITKLLWIAWDRETQSAFLQGEHEKEALGLLSAIFECPSRTARVCAGLLLSCVLASQLLENKEAHVARGVYALVEEMVALSPVWSQRAGGADGEDKPSAADKADAELLAFLNGLGQSEERFARILGCADAPWRLNDGSLPPEDSPLWASSAFALWALLKLRPKPARLASLRPALPTLAQAGCAPARVRWLAGELLLMLQLQSPLCASADEGELVVRMTVGERLALEASVKEQVLHSRQSLRSDLETNQAVMDCQSALTQERKEQVNLAASPWHQPLLTVLKSLGSKRGSLEGAVAETQARSESALSSIKHVLQLDFEGNGAEDRELSVKLEGMQEVEASYSVKKEEFNRCQEVLGEADAVVQECSVAMEAADKAVQEARKEVSDLESQITAKQREAQSKRTAATSDFSRLRGQIMAEMDSLKQKQLKIREAATKVQSGEPVKEGGAPLDATAAQEEMVRLRGEAAQLKARNAELQTELDQVDADPADLEQQALEAERAVEAFCCQRDGLRDHVQDLEGQHRHAREVWQDAMTRLQQARQAKELTERECSGLRQQLDSVWASWQPLWNRRLQDWRSKVVALAAARQGGRQLENSVGQGWEGLRAERQLRLEVLQAVQDLRGQLDGLERELLSVDDRRLDALDEH